VETLVKPPYLIMDGRRMIPDYDDLISMNYTYLAVGAMAMGPTPCDSEKVIPLKQTA
jgi:UDPglucose 6-dehydrogenase